jgi:phage terminase large subunit-like protein
MFWKIVVEDIVLTEWAEVAISLYDKYTADKIIAETNNGGQLVEYTLKTKSDDIPYKSVHASRGKRVRAEPIASLYEQKKVFHCGLFNIFRRSAM